MLAPTRELAQQIQVEATSLGRPLRVGNACLYGGASKGPQGTALRRYPQVCVLTKPALLIDMRSCACIAARARCCGVPTMCELTPRAACTHLTLTLTPLQMTTSTDRDRDARAAAGFRRVGGAGPE